MVRLVSPSDVLHPLVAVIICVPEARWGVVVHIIVRVILYSLVIVSRVDLVLVPREAHDVLDKPVAVAFVEQAW